MERGWQAASDLGAGAGFGSRPQDAAEPADDTATGSADESTITTDADQPVEASEPSELGDVLIRWSFEAGPDAPGAARSLVTEALAGSDADVDIVVLMVSELVTNAVLHTRRSAELRLIRLGPSGFRVEVEDRDGHIPTPKETPGARGGFGLRIIDTFARSWGTTMFGGPHGKVVWFEVDAGNRSP